MKDMIIYKELDGLYTKDTLIQLFEKYFFNWIKDGWVKSNLRYYTVAELSKVKKQELTDILYEFYTNKELFNKVYENFSPDLKETFSRCIWDGGVLSTDIEKKYKKKIVTKSSGSYFGINDEKIIPEYLLLIFIPMFSYFNDEVKVTFKLPSSVYSKLKEMINDKPVNYYINYQEQIKTSYKASFESEFIKNIEMYVKYIKTGNIEKTATGRISKKAILKFKNDFALEEMYPQMKDLELLKSEIIIKLFLQFNQNKLTHYEEIKNVEHIKKFAQEVMTGEFFSRRSFWAHEICDRYMRNYYFSNKKIEDFLKQIYEFIMILDENKWISTENLADYIVYRNFDFVFIEVNYNNYINLKGYEKLNLSTREGYINGVIYPFIKAYIMIMSFFGLLEIGYEIPQNKDYDKGNGYLSEYDGIKYFKITKFGAYVFGKIKDYEVEIKKSKAEILFDEDRLIITMIGEDILKASIIETVAKKITKGKYRADEKTIFKDIKNYEDLNRKIDVFKKNVARNLPRNWREFFEKILKNSNMVEFKNEVIVMKLKEDIEFLRKTAEDEELKKYIMKAENYHIIVEKKNISKVIDRFKELGYYMEYREPRM